LILERWVISCLVRNQRSTSEANRLLVDEETSGITRE
jgi:hypothetical protein